MKSIWLTIAIASVTLLVSITIPALDSVNRSHIGLVVVLSVLSIVTNLLDKKYLSSAYESRLSWFEFGACLLLIAAILSHPIIALAVLILTESVTRIVLGFKTQRLEASIVNTTSEFTVIVAASALFHSIIVDVHLSVLVLFMFGLAALIHEVGTSLLNPYLFKLVDGREHQPGVLQTIQQEKQRRFIFAAAYTSLTVAISTSYLASNIMVTGVSTTGLLGCVFFLRLWLQVRGELRGEYHPSWVIVSEQFAAHNSQFEHDFVHSPRVTITTNRQDEPVWNLAAMAFKILHTNQDRFVRHSLATGRLCEMVARELAVQLGDTTDIDTEESWVVGVLHDVALMDQPTQVLRFAERVERPIDLEIYEEKKEGGMMHLNLVDHRLPEVTSEDTDVLDEHPKIGAQLLAGWPNVAEVIEQHHTFSTDYDQLPLLAQILFVCEKYELLASENGYYTTVSKDEAIDAIREEYESIQEHPQVLNALITVLHNHDETFWNATDLDYDQEVQVIASRLKAYVDKQAPQSAPDQPKQTELKSFHPFERHQAYATPTPHADNSLS